MKEVMFNGRNIVPNSPEELTKVVNFLNKKAEVGEFEFSETPSYWAKHERVIRTLGLGHDVAAYYFAVSLAFIAVKNDGRIVFAEKDHVWSWAWSFHLIAGIAGWNSDFMVRVIQSFEGKEDNIDGLMSWATQIYGNAYYNDAVTLMSLLPHYRVDIMAGLMANNFERYCAEYPAVDNKEDFALAFVKANSLKQNEVNKAFDTAITLPSFTSIAAMAFFLSIRGKLDEKRKGKCEEVILNLINGDTTPYVTPLCNWMLMEQEVTAFEEECVLSLIKGLRGEKKEVSLDAIDNSIGIHVKNPELLTKIFVCIAENLQPTDVLRMEGCLRSLHEHNDFFQNMVLSFVMHPKGVYRIAGRKLWDNFHLESSSFDAKKDLPEEFQCLFVISMLQDYGNPETRLPKLLPLIDSKSERVRNILIGQLGPYLDDYMGHVINALNRLKLESRYVDVIKQYYERRADALEKRRSMKELSPRYSHMSEFQETMRLQKVHMQEQMREAEKGHKSFLKDIAKNVVLARGGGWRDENGVVHHLAHIKFSMPSRQLVQSMTPMEQEDWLNRVVEDWDVKTGNN